jgi:hypothetical protein
VLALAMLWMGFVFLAYAAGDNGAGALIDGTG